MNYEMKNLPERTQKPRKLGLNMVMDKGLSTREAEDFLSVAAPLTDVIKLGFGTSYVSPNLKEKLDMYRSNGIPFYFGGTLFEAFIARNDLDGYKRLVEKYELKYVEVSDGCLEIPHERKCELITEMAKYATVLSEVGSKDEEKVIAPYLWIQLMQAEIEAGAYKVIAEARESGTVGIFRKDGEVREGLVKEILHKIPEETVIWEAPQKSQQVWFIELLGSNVNLGNIAPSEVIPLETLRLGLRGDTFHNFL